MAADPKTLPAGGASPATARHPVPSFQTVATPARKTDGPRLATGRGQFVDDINLKGLLFARILHSPHAHARIRRIDAKRARALPGVVCVLTHEDVKRIAYTTAGQGAPEPSPYDNFVLDNKVRFVGDKVAAVAAETMAIAEEALRLITVDYEILPAVFDPEEALKPGAPVIHDESEALQPDPAHKTLLRPYDAPNNIAARVEAQVGDVQKGFSEADIVIENTYEVGWVQQTPIEPHVTITYLDEEDRLTIRTSTQVPFHCRRIVAQALAIPIQKIRVIKPRIGGGFGAKQEILNEELCAALTLATRLPVRMEYTREEEFVASRTRHPQKIRMKTGVKRDGSITAQEMIVLANTGSYGAHSLTVQCNSGSKSLPLYRCPNIRFVADAIYTNLPVAGAFRGYGGPQGLYAMECQMDEAAHALGLDPIEFRRKNAIREGDSPPILRALGEGKEGYEQIITTCALEECIERGMKEIGWTEKRRRTPGATAGTRKRGIGVALAMHGSGIPGVDMGAASIKMNEDGSFNLFVGATDLGTGSDTIFTQISGETLAVAPERITILSSDTDLTPFDTGAYASSTTYISGMAVKKASAQCLEKIMELGAKLLGVQPDACTAKAGAVHAGEKSVSYSDIAHYAFYQGDQEQPAGYASHMSFESPPPFAANFAEVEVDTETGVVKVLKYVTAVDVGIPINPLYVEAQQEGGIMQAMGYALWEEMIFDPGTGRMLNSNFNDYKIATTWEMPELKVFIIPTYEPSGPFGAKAAAEIPMDGPAPAVANAIFNATGVRLRAIPFTPERVWRALRKPSS